MADSLAFILNGTETTVNSTPDTPLLYVLTDELELQGPRFGCGLAQCGSCSVLIDGIEQRSCVTPLASVARKEVTTLEGLTAYHAKLNRLDKVPEFTPLQEAIIEEQAIQCGYCYNGLTIKATELLNNNPKPSELEIREALNGHLCRCGTYPKLISAIQKVALKMEGKA
jgi:aerobic-type carbon monoxide dehydrogenase small subunit (CoxS/CutS family)